MRLLSGLMLRCNSTDERVKACLAKAVSHWFTVEDIADFRRTWVDDTALTTISEAWTSPLKDQPTSTTPSTTTSPKDETTTSIPLKDQTSTTTSSAKDVITTSEAFLSLTIPAKDQTPTTSVPLKDQTSITTLPSKEPTSISHVSVFSSLPAKDQATSSSEPIKDQWSALTITSKDRTTSSLLFTSTLPLTKVQITSSTMPLKDKTSTSTLFAKDETMMSTGMSSSVPAKDQTVYTSLPFKDQSSTSTLPSKDKATVTSECLSTTLPTKDKITSASVPLERLTSTSSVPAKDEKTKVSSPKISSTTVPAKDKPAIPTGPSKDQTVSSSVASKDIKTSVLTVMAPSLTYSNPSTSAPFEDQVYTSSSSIQDKVFSFTMTIPPFDNMTASIPFKDQETTISSQSAKDVTMTSLVAKVSTDVFTLSEVSEGLYTTVSALPTKDEPAITTSLTRSIAFYKNITITATVPGTDLSPVSVSVSVLSSTTSGEFIYPPGKGGNSTLSNPYSPSTTVSFKSSTATAAESFQKDKTLAATSSSLPAKYFPGLLSSSGPSLPAKDLSMSASSPAPAPITTTGVLVTLPTVSTVVVPLNYTLGLLRLSSTSPNVTGILQELPTASTITASAVLTLGLLPLSGINSSETRGIPAAFSISTVSTSVAITLGVSSLSSTSTITPLIVLTVTKSTEGFTAIAHLPSEVSNATSTPPMLASMQGMSTSVASPIMVLPVLGQTPSVSISASTSVAVPSSLVAPNTSGLTPTETLLSSLRGFDSTVPSNSAMSLSFVAPSAQSLATEFPSYILATPTPIEPDVEQSTMVLTTIDTPIPLATRSSAMIPLYTPDLLGNAYGGGYITTPSVYVVVTSTPMVGVPPGYGYSIGPEGTTIILSISAPPPSFPSSEETSNLPAVPLITGFGVSGIAQSPTTSVAGNKSFLAPSQPSSPTTFQGSASRYGAALLTLLLGLLTGSLVH
ncbi:Mucin-12 [Xylographa pallens]|nr:Mucin-12 [Xylographa pallens]